MGTYSWYSHVYRKGQILRAQKALVLSCIVHVQIGVKVFTGIVKYHRYRVSNTCLVGQGSHTSSKHAKYVKYTHDTRARKWRSIASQYRSKRGQYTTILGIGGKQTPFLGEIDPSSLQNCTPGTAAKARQSRWVSRYGHVGVRYLVYKNRIAEKRVSRSTVLSLTTYEHARDWIIDAELPRRLAYFQRVTSAVHALPLLFRPESPMLLHATPRHI